MAQGLGTHCSPDHGGNEEDWVGGIILEIWRCTVGRGCAPLEGTQGGLTIGLWIKDREYHG